MARADIRAPGGAAAEKFLRDRFGISWGPDVFGIAEDGVSAESIDGGSGLMHITLVAKCSRADVERFISLLWSKPPDGEGRTDG